MAQLPLSADTDELLNVLLGMLLAQGFELASEVPQDLLKCYIFASDESFPRTARLNEIQYLYIDLFAETPGLQIILVESKSSNCFEGYLPPSVWKIKPFVNCLEFLKLVYELMPHVEAIVSRPEWAEVVSNLDYLTFADQWFAEINNLIENFNSCCCAEFEKLVRPVMDNKFQWPNESNRLTQVRLTKAKCIDYQTTDAEFGQFVFDVAFRRRVLFNCECVINQLEYLRNLCRENYDWIKQTKNIFLISDFSSNKFENSIF